MKINSLNRAIRTALGLGAVSLTFGMMPITVAQAGGTAPPSAQWTGIYSGDWTDAGNWTAAPSAGSDVMVTDLLGSPNTNVIYTNPGPSPVGALNSVVVDGAPASNMTLNQSTDNLSTGALTVGDGGTGTFNQDSTTTNVSGNLILGNQASGNGTYTVTGDTAQTNVNFVAGGNGSNPNGALIVGNEGAGSFTQGTNILTDPNNQVNVAGDLTLGHQSGSSGTYLLNSGTLTVGGQAAVGGQTGSSGTFTQNGGTLILTNSANQPSVNPDYASVPPGSGAWGGKLAVGGGVSSNGGNDGGIGTYTMTGGHIDATANGIEIGPSGTGIMHQSGGTVDTTFLTEGFAGTGTYNLSGTGTINSYSESVGYAGTGTFNQSGGTHTIASDLRVGAQYSTNTPGNGTYNLSNGVLNSGNTYVGQGETGSIVVTDPIALSSTHNVSGNLILGTLGLPDNVNPQPAGNGSYSITGSSSQLNVNFASGGNGTGNPNGALIVGSDNGSIGTFVQGKGDKSDTGNQVNVAGDLVVGLNTGSQGIYTLNTGTLTVGGAMTVGAASAANNQFIQNGGTVNLNGSAGGNGDYASARTAGGVVWPGSLIVGGDQPFSDGAGTYTLNSGNLNASSIYVGYSGTGNFNQSSGIVNAGYIDLGDCGGCNGGNSFGKYTLTGDGAVNVSTMNIGDFGHGEFVQNGAASSVAITGDLNIGNGAAAHPNDANPGNWDRSGSYTLEAGSLSTNNTIVGAQGVGTFTQTGGQHVVANTLTIGQQWLPDNGQTPVSFGGPAPGTYTMTAGTLTAGGDGTTHAGIIVGDAGNGTFNQTGGSVTSGVLGGQQGNLVIGAQLGSTGIYNLGDNTNAAPTLQVYGDAIIGRDAAGSVTVPDPNSTSANPLPDITVHLADANGTLAIAGNGTVMNVNAANGTGGNMQVGVSGVGAVTQKDASLVSIQHDLTLGANAGSHGTYTMTNGTLAADVLRIGDQGTGSFVQSGGTVNVNNASSIVVLAENVGTTGSYALSGTGTLNATVLDVGDSGHGSFSQNGGITNAGSLLIGMYGPASGEASVGDYNLQSGALNTGTTVVGQEGTGTFEQSGGNHTITASSSSDGTLHVGSVAGSNGGYTLSGGALSANWEKVGENGTGTFSQNAGTNTVHTTLEVGSSGNGAYQLSGTGQLNAGYETIGRYNGSVGQFTQSGGSNSVTHDLNVGGQGGATGQGTYTLTGGSLTVGGTTTVGAQGAGIFNQQDSSVTTGNLVLGSQAGSSGAYTLTDTVAVNPTILNVTGNEVVGDAGLGTFTQHAGEHTVGGDLSIANQTSANGSSVTLDNTAGASSLAVSGTLFVGNGGNGSFNLNNGSLTTTNTFIGNGGVGTFTQTGGTHTVNGTPGATGNLFVGYTSNGTYNQSGGSTIAPAIGVGVVAGSVGNYNLSGGSLTGGLVLGYGGQGHFTQSNTDGASTVTVNNNLHLGELTSSSGSYTLDGGSLQVTGANKNEIIGVGGAGTFTQNGGSHSVDGVLSLGGQNGTLGTGTYNLNGGSLTVGTALTPGWAFVGENGTGAFNQSNAASVTVNGNLALGRYAGSQGTYTLNGGTLDVVGTGSSEGILAVGNRGQGALIQNGGNVSTNQLLVAGGPGTPSTGQGSYSLSSGTLTANLESIGNTGTGSLTQATGTTNTAGALTLGNSSGSNGTYQLNGGNLTATSLTVGNSGQGTFNQAGGSNAVTGNVVIANSAGSGGSSYNLSGGSLAAANLNVNTGGTFNFSGGSFSLASGAGTLTNEGQVNISGTGTRTVEGNVINDGTFKVTDTSVSYTGTFINNGAYLSDPSTSTFTNLTISASGYLQGGAGDQFILSGNLTNNSTQTGLWNTSSATLDFIGAGSHTADFGSSSVFQWGQLVLDAGTQLILGSNLYVTKLELADYMQLIDLLTGNSYKVNVGNFYVGGQYESYATVIAYLNDNGHAILTGDLIQLSSAPEPGLFLLMSLGLGGMFFSVRRRKA